MPKISADPGPQPSAPMTPPDSLHSGPPPDPTEPLRLRITVDGGDVGVVELEHPAVPPPTVGQALAVLTGDVVRARSALRSWLPEPLAQDVAPLGDRSVLYLSARLLYEFTPAVAAPPSAEPGDERPPQGPAERFTDVVAVAAALGLAPDDALTMPWPVYLARAHAAGSAHGAGGAQP